MFDESAKTFGEVRNMASASAQEVKMTPTLGLTGVTVNAMALIAPGGVSNT